MILRLCGYLWHFSLLLRHSATQIAHDAKRVLLLERFSKLGQHLAEERRLEKVQEEYGFLAPSKLMLQVDEENKNRELEELAAQEAD